MTKAASAAAKDFAAAGVGGVHLAWADNNGIPRSRIVPVGGLADAATRGVGATSLFAVFDSHDAITYGHAGLATPSGDIRLVPVVERLRRLAGQPALAWAPVRQLTQSGEPWPYCQRAVLEAQVAEAARRGLEFRAGYEIEFAVAPGGQRRRRDRPGTPGPPTARTPSSASTTSSPRSCTTSPPTACGSASCTPSTASRSSSCRWPPPTRSPPPTTSCWPARPSTPPRTRTASSSASRR